MHKKVTKLVLIVNIFLLAFLVIAGAIFCQWYYTKSSAIVGFDAKILGYSETDDGIVIFVQKDNSLKIMPCLIPNGKLKEICTDDRCWPVIENRLTAVAVRIFTEEYYIGEARLSENFIYPLRTLIITPGELDRIYAEGLLPG